MFKNIIIFLVVSFCIACNAFQKQIILVPEGVDTFVIIYGCECGVQIEQKDGINEFEIPSNGILLVKNNWENNVTNTDIYRKLGNGNKILLQSISPGKDSIIKKVNSYFMNASWNGKSICNSRENSMYEHKCIVYEIEGGEKYKSIEDTLFKHLITNNN